MTLSIDETRLELLLTQKRDFIGRRVSVSAFVSAVSLLLSAVTGTYSEVFGIDAHLLKWAFVLLGLYSVSKLAFDFFKNGYSFDDLLADINRLNEVKSSHSIVVIKDSFNEFPNRFLVYDDKRWGCRFFLNFKHSENNESFIKSRLSSELKIDERLISIRHVKDVVHHKLSVPDDREKIYMHAFFECRLGDTPKRMMDDSFAIDGRTYHWMTMDAMESDETIMKKNAEVLKDVKSSF